MVWTVEIALFVAAVVLACAGGFVFLVTALAELPLAHWPVRMWDFPRLQALVFAGVTGVLSLVVTLLDGHSGWDWIVPAAMLAVIIRQAIWIWPYLSFAAEDVHSAEAKPGDEAMLSILISNVLQSNAEHDKWRQVVGTIDVDLIACAETNQRWIDQIGQEVQESHPHTVFEPRDNMYGMSLWSRLPLEDVEIEHVVQDDIPSIHGTVVLPNDQRVRFHCLHPRPPAPQENDSSAPRDAELMVLARRIAEQRDDGNVDPTVVMGDLNDVAWSRTTQLFQQISGLLDPRRGRGLFNSFHAQHWWVRFPLDHIFVSEDFRLIEMRRLPEVGSDHFPMLIRVALDPTAAAEQEGPTADEEDLDAAERRVGVEADREARGEENGHVADNPEASEHDVAHNTEKSDGASS